MRAVLEREISDGTQTYRLWRSAGKSVVKYPRAENDKYLLYLEINGYLASLRMTDFNLTDICGFDPAAQKLYGGKENRGTWLNAIEESGGYEAVSAAVAEERDRIGREGVDSALWERVKKGVYGNKVRGLNSFEQLCVGQAQAFFAGHAFLRFADLFDTITKEEAEELIENWVRPERTALSVVRAKEET